MNGAKIFENSSRTFLVVFLAKCLSSGLSPLKRSLERRKYHVERSSTKSASGRAALLISYFSKPLVASLIHSARRASIHTSSTLLLCSFPAPRGAKEFWVLA